MSAKKSNNRALIIGLSIALSMAGLIVAAVYQKRNSRARAAALPRPTQRQEIAQQLLPPKLQEPLGKIEELQPPTITNKDAAVISSESPIRRSTVNEQASSSTSDDTPPMSSKENEISVPAKAKQAQESIKELILAGVQEAKRTAEKTGRQLKGATVDIAATADSKDIHSLEPSDINAMAALFEETMAEIQKEGYNEQVILMDAYKKLLQEHIRVIDARKTLASRLKPGA